MKNIDYYYYLTVNCTVIYCIYYLLFNNLDNLTYIFIFDR